MYFASRQSPSHQATAQVLLTTVITGNIPQNPAREAQTQAEFARFPAVVSRVLSATKSDLTTGEFLESSSVSVAQDADVLSFNVTAPLAPVAETLATSYATEFTRLRQELDRRVLEDARKEIHARIEALERDPTSSGAAREALIAKEQELRTLAALQRSNSYVVREADTAESQQRSQLQAAIVGLVIGLLLGLGAAFVLEALDTRVRSAIEVSERLGLPLLARIAEAASSTARTDESGDQPYRLRIETSPEPRASERRWSRHLTDPRPSRPPNIPLRGDVQATETARGSSWSGLRSVAASIARSPASERTSSSIAMVSDPSSQEAESYRMLRASLEFARLNGDFRVVMVTSAVRGEGKSTLVANLAFALARVGVRTLAVDMDFREPRLHRLFELDSNIRGLADVARGRVELDDAITRIRLDPAGPGSVSPESHLRVARGPVTPIIERVAVDFLAAGALPPDAGGFVGTNALRNILSDLRSRADVVLVDTPPVLYFGDAMTISREVDALIVVTRLDIVRRSELNELGRVLSTCPTRMLGFVVVGGVAEQRYGHYRRGEYPSFDEEEMRLGQIAD